jgi:diaminopimelate decarboxylase
LQLAFSAPAHAIPRDANTATYDPDARLYLTAGARMAEQTFFVSGLHSGPSPSAGLGIARSLRAAFGSARIVGVDYWAGASGFHHDVFDDIWLKPSWDLIEDDLYARELSAELARGACWIPALDLEIAWLARKMAPHPRLLAPGASALAQTGKPAPAVAPLLPFEVPPGLDLNAADDEIYSFCRAHSWRVWVKGPYHDAIAVANWPELERARAQLRKCWQSDRLSLQAHIRGYEESIAFAAVGGAIADAVMMRKRIITPDGKTWAGRIGDVPDDLLGPIEAAVRAVGWTGGAELELLRDVDGRRWLNEWNPRFPAWIHGATLAGRNLPAALVRSALGLTGGAQPLSERVEFTRVVLEIPVRPDLPLPLQPEPEHGQVGASGKYGAALSAIVPKLAATENRRAAAPAMSAELTADLCDAATATATATATPTPHRALFRRTAEAAFAALDRRPSRSAGPQLRFAYSLKTCPDAEYLALARKAGMLAECISLLEVRRALAADWSAADIVLNGPGKWWPESEARPDGLRAVFCDSVEELERLASSGRRDALWGVRLRVPGLRSRFGIPVDELDAFERLCATVSSLPAACKFGVHVHTASTLVGIGHWRDAVESAVVWAATLESATGREVSVLDLGGGYHPDDIARVPFADIAEFAASRLAGLEQVYVEPGRALTQATMGVVTRVLDVRRRRGQLDEVVVDACIAELPLAASYPHRIFALTRSGPVPIPRGRVRLLGRICMEDDVLSPGLALPPDLAIGDRLVVCDAGAYERSMSYAFGCGGYS